MGAPPRNKADQFRHGLANGFWADTPAALKAQLDKDAERIALQDPGSAASVIAQTGKDRVDLNKKYLPAQAPDMADTLLKASRFGLLGKRTRQSSFLSSPGSTVLGG